MTARCWPPSSTRSSTAAGGAPSSGSSRASADEVLPIHCLGMAAETVGIGEAAKLLGVSTDTLRRWDPSGRIETTRDGRKRPRGPPSEIERLRDPPPRHATGDGFSARNRFPGTIRSVEVDGVMALIEIEAGPHLVTAAITRDSVEELGLAPGMKATAMVKASSVMVQRGE